MEILWWWAPAGVVTLLAVAWVSWYGRDGRGEVDRDEAVKKMAAALTREPKAPAGYGADPHLGNTPLRSVQPTRLRSTGIAVRPTRDRPPVREAHRSDAPWSGGSDSA